MITYDTKLYVDDNDSCVHNFAAWIYLRGENPRGIARPSSPRIREMCGFRVASTVPTRTNSVKERKQYWERSKP